jgi:hypothetical protein
LLQETEVSKNAGVGGLILPATNPNRWPEADLQKIGEKVRGAPEGVRIPAAEVTVSISICAAAGRRGQGSWSTSRRKTRPILTV